MPSRGGAEIVQRVLDEGFRGVDGVEEMVQQISGQVYCWADEVLTTTRGDGREKVEEMGRLMQLSINVMNNKQGNKLDFLQGICMKYCGYELLDMLIKCFGGCLRCKDSMIKQKGFKHNPKFVKITNYRPNSLQDALIN